MAIAKSIKVACRAAIEEHLARVGSRDWDAVRAAYPSVPETTFWRWVRATRAAVLLGKVQTVPVGDEQAAKQDAADDAAFDEDCRNRVADLGENLRRPPGLSDLCRREAIDPLAVLTDGLAVTAEIIDSSRGADGKIRNPKMVLVATNVRSGILRTAAAVSETLTNERAVRDFYRAIMDEIAAESPACAARIAARLEALNARAGLVGVVGG